MNERIDPQRTAAFHITDVSNLAAILARGGLLSDAQMVARAHTNIGYDHIKQRRLSEIQIGCCPGQPFVGAFVPFYYCPRSVMLFTINRGNTGLAVGCQTTIIHLVFRVATLAGLGHDWAISDGNAGAYHALFYNELGKLSELDWAAIRATSWKGLTHQKQAEFLVKDFVPWSAVEMIGCHDEAAASAVRDVLAHGNASHIPRIEVKRSWYY